MSASIRAFLSLMAFVNFTGAAAAPYCCPAGGDGSFSTYIWGGYGIVFANSTGQLAWTYITESMDVANGRWVNTCARDTPTSETATGYAIFTNSDGSRTEYAWSGGACQKIPVPSTYPPISYCVGPGTMYPVDLGKTTIGYPPIQVHIWAPAATDPYFPGGYQVIMQEESCMPVGFVSPPGAGTYMNVSATPISDPAFWELPSSCGA